MITRNFSHGPKWIPGFITKITGPVSYKVMLGDGSIVRRHVDQILASYDDKDLGKPKFVDPLGLPESSAAASAAAASSIPEGKSCVPEEETRCGRTSCRKCQTSRNGHSFSRYSKAVTAFDCTCTPVGETCVEAKLFEGLWALF